MSSIEEVGRKMLIAVGNKRDFKWERTTCEMCYKTTIGFYEIEVRKNMFRVYNSSGDELDTVVAKSFGCFNEPAWIEELWGHAHTAVLNREKVFDELLACLEGEGDG